MIQTEKINLYIPCKDDPIEWENNDFTVIIGMNGSGKTLTLNAMKEYCLERNISYCDYHAPSALKDYENRISAATPDNILFTIKALTMFSQDLDIDIWAQHRYGRDFDFLSDHELAKEVLVLAGNGYSRMVLLILNALERPQASYYFIDGIEASLHITALSHIVPFMVRFVPDKKIVLTTRSPEVFNSYLTDQKIHNLCQVISL